MAHISFVTSESLEGYFFDPRQPNLTIDDMILYDELERRGHKITPLAWTSPEAQNPAADLIIIRSPWDYFEKASAFRAWMQDMGKINAPLYNKPEQILWNLRKTYLSALEDKGVGIVPTLFVNKGEQLGADFFKQMGDQELVIKPQEGANAYLIERLGQNPTTETLAHVNKVLLERDYMIQPFLNEIIEVGEWSCVFFNGQYSHGFLKRPKAGDFRVQEEHGGSLHKPQVPQEIIAITTSIMAEVDFTPLYARVDGVVVKDQFLLMELEMFEPELYFRVDDKAAPNMADAIESLL